MTLARSVAFSAEEVFRVDAKAEKDKIPFPAIASLEFTAILTALILFGKGAKWTGRRAKMHITGITDNLGKRFLGAQISQLQISAEHHPYGSFLPTEEIELRHGLRMVPTNQNSQADALTNSSFEDFDEARRIVVEFEDIEFIVLGELMAEAGKPDEDIKLVKSSKEAKQDKFARERSPRQRKGEMKWRDPWSLVRTGGTKLC